MNLNLVESVKIRIFIETDAYEFSTRYGQEESLNGCLMKSKRKAGHCLNDLLSVVYISVKLNENHAFNVHPHCKA